MACTCLEKIEKDVLAKVAEMNPTYTITDGDFDNKIWTFGGEHALILTHKFEYEYYFKKVNGSNSTTRKGKINVNPIYCGFCGVKFIEDVKV